MNVLEKDIKELITQKKYFQGFENCKILITGATGLIGSILVKTLLTYAKENNVKIIVYACCRNEKKFYEVFENYQCPNLRGFFSDILDIDISNLDIDYIVHGASVTDSKTFVEKPVETIKVALEGTTKILDQCIGKKLKGIVYLSSLEVYGSFTDINTKDEKAFENIKNVTETDYGYIDTLSVRSSYSESKRMVENICISYGHEYDLPIKICRLCQTFGAGVEYNDNRVFAQFARSVLEKKDIVLKTKGETIRNYCYTTDAISGILRVLEKGTIGEAYNVANKDTTISIYEMAKLVCSLYAEKNISVIFDLVDDITKAGYNPVVKLQLDTTKLEKLDWEAKVPLKEMFVRLIDSLGEM